MRSYILAFVTSFLFGVIVFPTVMYRHFGPVGTSAESVVLAVPQQQEGFSVFQELRKNSLIRNPVTFIWLYRYLAPDQTVVPGGYRLHKGMDARQIIGAITGVPDLVWVDIRQGRRKEEVGERIAAVLGWEESEATAWNGTRTDVAGLREGIFLAGSYLIDREASASAVYRQFAENFLAKAGPVMDKAQAQNMSPVELVTFASLLEREAAGAHDMPLIAGIIRNRLERGMRLDIDATLQYIKGNADEGWWQRVVPADKFLDSPYNTYRRNGLPPQPIASPGLAALEAVLNPESTDCLFYLHAKRVIYCAQTYEEHKQNIAAYLN